jgi:uncharacterized protein YrrD
LQNGAVGVLPREDIRGFIVKDRNAAKVGEVDDLVIDAEAGRVRFMKVGSGGLLGIGRDHRLVPVDVIDGVAGDTVFIRPAVAHVEMSPSWGDLESEIFVGDIYHHFSCVPYWSDGYLAPDWTRRDE